MRTLHFGLRVADLERSLAFYTAVGYEVVGSVPETAFGHLTMLKLPDDGFVTIELVHDPTEAEMDLGTASATSSSRWSRWTPPSPSSPPTASTPTHPRPGWLRRRSNDVDHRPGR
jgi:catechol 2,3-dioxygenase-like lactoylglutathione lyase family enzyme